MPRINLENNCVPKNKKTQIAVIDDEKDFVQIDLIGSKNGVVVASQFIEYTPNLDFVGSDNITVELSDKFFWNFDKS